MDDFAERVGEHVAADLADRAREAIGSLVQPAQYVGEVWSLSYDAAIVQVHDHFRQRVGGIPAQCFLVATRIQPDMPLTWSDEDCSVVLVRVTDAAPVPGDQERQLLRAEAARRVAGQLNTQWDDPSVIDGYTANQMNFAGIRCRVIGTFYLDRDKTAGGAALVLKFGSDISNYYPNRGLKVYKPNGLALHRIVNYRDVTRLSDHPLADRFGNVGRIRYASTDRSTGYR